MLAFARAQVGKPFSNTGMARSLVWPRTTDGSSWFCAELVAAILKVGGLLSMDSNPGAATPHGLYKMYSRQAAATANPYTLRAVQQAMTTRSLLAPREVQEPLLRESVATGAMPVAIHTARSRSDSPPRASFRLLSTGPPVASARGGVRLSLNSLGRG